MHTKTTDLRSAVESGRHLFEDETFGGNGRTCLTCHTRRTGTVSPDDARERFERDPGDPLFNADGSDDGNGNGVHRMLADATVLVRVPLADNVSLADDPSARSVVVRRGIPTTLNTPSLDPVLMLDGRQPSLEAQVRGAIVDHAQRHPRADRQRSGADRRVRTDAAVLQLEGSVHASPGPDIRRRCPRAGPLRRSAAASSSRTCPSPRRIRRPASAPRATAARC